MELGLSWGLEVREEPEGSSDPRWVGAYALTPREELSRNPLSTWACGSR